VALSIEVNVLKKIPLFADIDPGKLLLIAFAGQRIPCGKGEVLCTQDEDSDSVYIVLEGEVEILREGTGTRTLLARLGPGSLLGEIGVLCNRTRTATVVAATQVTVLRIEKDVFIEFVHELPQLSIAIIQELSRRLDSMNRQLAEARAH
jgi:CRP-like cAMP-binding protein